MNKIKIHSWIKKEKNLIIISLIFFLNLLGFLFYFQHLLSKGFLPSPFLYNKADTFMDFYNTLFWSHSNEKYTEWKSVYPPLNFLILRFVDFIFGGETLNSPFSLRENSPYLVLSVIIFYLASNMLILNTKYWKDFNNIEKILIYLALILSTPVLFSFERANLILICPAIFFLVLISSGIKRSLFLAVLINIKPYFFIINIYYFFKKDWKGLLNSVLLSGLIYFLTSIVMGGELFEFFKNIFDFSQKESIFSLREVMSMPSSISAFSFVLNNESGAVFASRFIDFQYIEFLIQAINTFEWMILLFSFIVIWRNIDKITDLELFTIIVLMISNMNIFTGGYIYIMYFFFVPIFLNMYAKNFYITCLFLIAIPLDFISLINENIGIQLVYLTNVNIDVHWTLGLGSVIRPVVNILLLIGMSCEILIRSKRKECLILNQNKHSK